MAATASFAELAQIDGLGYVPIDEEGSRLLFQTVSDAYETQSLIYAADIEFSGRDARPETRSRATCSSTTSTSCTSPRTSCCQRARLRNVHRHRHAGPRT